MKKMYFITIIISILAEVTFFIISFFLSFPWQEMMIAIMIAIPIAIPILIIISPIILGSKPKYPEMMTPSTTLKQFLQAQPYICEECEEFTTTFREICENCGAKNTLRSSTKMDYKSYILKKNS